MLCAQFSVSCFEGTITKPPNFDKKILIQESAYLQVSLAIQNRLGIR